MSPVHPSELLLSTTEPIADSYDVAMLDLDGVVYTGDHAVAHAASTLAKLRGDGLRLAYITNNASRRPVEVARKLAGLGVEAEPTDVVTSAQAVARLVARQVPPGSTVLLVGADALAHALGERGLSVTGSARDDPAAVVQGFSPTVDWTLLAEGAYAVQAGADWFASNPDRTLPTPRGFAPGNGVLVDAVAAATGTRPVVAGKPEPALFEETLLRVGGRHPIVIGDRLDTDIEGANAVDAASLAVLTGVSDLADLAAASAVRRPTYVGPDLRAMTYAQPAVDYDADWFVCSGHAVRRVGDQLESAGADGAAHGYDAAVAILRASLTAAWASDRGTRPDVSTVTAKVREFVG